MLSSISSSSTSVAESSDFERAIPDGPWLSAIAAGLLITLGLVAAMEWRLAARGFRATVNDSPELWVEQRTRASSLGDEALILVGASRIQLALDLPELGRLTGLEPVQLAVDGSSLVPVLKDLSEDPAVTGTVIVSYQDKLQAGASDYTAALVRGWRESSARPSAGAWDSFNYDATEAYLEDAVDAHLRSHADGTRAITALLQRVLDPRVTPQYLVTLPSRARNADYRLVPMPEYYYLRVLRQLGNEAPEIADGTSVDDVGQQLQEAVAKVGAATMKHYPDAARQVAEMASRIESRGGRVYFAVFPTSGMIRELEHRRYPRELYWNQFAAMPGVRGLHFEDVPELQAFECPDGSHLDYRDQLPFTRALVKALQLGSDQRS